MVKFIFLYDAFNACYSKRMFDLCLKNIRKTYNARLKSFNVRFITYVVRMFYVR